MEELLLDLTFKPQDIRQKSKKNGAAVLLKRLSQSPIDERPKRKASLRMATHSWWQPKRAV